MPEIKSSVQNLKKGQFNAKYYPEYLIIYTTLGKRALFLRFFEEQRPMGGRTFLLKWGLKRFVKSSNRDRKIVQ